MPRAKTVALVALAAFVLMGSAAGAQQTRRYIDPRTPADKGLPPFSGAVEIGNTLYLSGHLGLDQNQKVPATPEAEARQLLDNFQATLAKAGYTMDDLVFVQLYCPDVAHYDAFNTAYRTYFKQEFPARAFIGSGPLLVGARFELQGIAVKRKAEG
jgi:2-iminobutanoate/2-iminopropanoate deaminase